MGIGKKGKVRQIR